LSHAKGTRRLRQNAPRTETDAAHLVNTGTPEAISSLYDELQEKSL
jgi:hypothetical protein